MQRHIKVSLIGFFFCALLFWPGLLRPDSITQMHQGIAGAFNDFHPPMLGLMLGISAKFVFLMHLAIYWVAVTIYFNAEKNYVNWFVAIFPPIICYQLLIIKDIAFVNSYLFGCAWLYFYSVRKFRPSHLSLLVWLVIVFYGTAAVYQSLIVLVWICLWFGKVYWPDSDKKWLYGGIVSLVFITLVSIFNYSLTSPTYSNQHLRLYDLAGISMHIEQPIFPDYILENPRYDFERIKNLYNTSRVDDLTYPSDTPLPQAINEAQRNDLKSTWISAIVHHPVAYLKHRFGIFYRQLSVSLLKKPSEVKGEINNNTSILLNWISSSFLFDFAKWMMAYVGYFFIQILLIYKSYKHFNEHPKYVAVFFQNVSSIALIGAIFFCANAAEARYAYLPIALCCFSLPMLLRSHKF